MDRRGEITDSERERIPTDYDQLEMSEWRLDRSDIAQIRDKLELTPTQRLMAAQDFINTVIRIRAQNDDRARFDEVFRVLTRNVSRRLRACS